MDSLKMKTDFVSAYKLSRPGVTTKTRIHRRSMEWKEQRHDEVNRRRNIVNLSPVDEANSSRDKSYKNKTPVKGNVKNATAPKVQDRLDMLKKWKQERVLKQKHEANSKVKKPVFKTGKIQDHKCLDVKPAKGGRKPTPQSSVVPPKPAPKVVSKVSAPTHTNKPVTRTTRATRGKPEPVKPKTQTAPAPRVRRTRQTQEVPTTRTTRTRSATRTTETTRITRSSKNKSSDEEKEHTLEEESVVTSPKHMDSINMTRGDPSFAPPEFTFTAPSNLTSFIFKPMSPASAANFLNPSQDSFMGTSPKRCSTPKARKVIKEDENITVADQSLLNSTASNSTVTQRNEATPKTASPASSTVLEKSEHKTPVNTSAQVSGQETSVNMDSKTSSIRKSRRSSVRRSIVVASECQESETTTIDEVKDNAPSTPVRRSSRCAVKTSTDTADCSQNSVGQKNRSSTLSFTEQVPTPVAIETIPEVEKDESVFLVTDSPAKKMRSSSRRSVMSSKTSSVSSNSESEELVEATKVATPSKTRRSLRKSMLKSDQDSDDGEKIESPSKRRRFKEQQTDRQDTEDSDCSEKSAPIERVAFDKFPAKKTPARKTSRKSFQGFAQPDANAKVLSTKRKPRRSFMPKSPEDWVEVLSNSPMVEMSRRKPRFGGDVPSFDLDEVPSEVNAVAMETDEVTDTVSVSATEEGVGLSVDSTKTDSEGVLTNVSPVEPMVTSEAGAVQPVEAAVKSPKPSSSDQSVQDVGITSTAESTSSHTEGDSVEKHDVPYFRKLIVSESDRLNSLGDHWTKINDETELTEEVRGQIRTTVGQAQLLIRQRFKQFTGLIDNCEFGTGEKETTYTDLQGFWDMIYFQVEDVDAKFDKLVKLQKNNWEEEKSDKPVVKKIKKKVVNVKKPAVKSKFAAFRAQMKKKPEEPVVVPKLEKVFDAGFFKVTSPVRKSKFHCDAGTPKKSLTPSMESSNKKSDNTPQALSDSNSAPSSTGLTTDFQYLKVTPARRSYAPVVPSPLLIDSTPQPRPKRTSTRKTPLPKKLLSDQDDVIMSNAEKENIVNPSTPKRKSLRVRKSVSFGEEAAAVASPVKCSDADFSRLLQPISQTDDNLAEEITANDSFSKYLKPTIACPESPKENVDSPKTRRSRVSLKTCPSSSRRRSSRGVQFSPNCISTKSSINSHPSTPFNQDSLVADKMVRRSSRSLRSDVLPGTPVANRDSSSRLSLLYTPPVLNLSRQVKDIPTATLISFSP